MGDPRKSWGRPEVVQGKLWHVLGAFWEVSCQIRKMIKTVGQIILTKYPTLLGRHDSNECNQGGGIFYPMMEQLAITTGERENELREIGRRAV